MTVESKSRFGREKAHSDGRLPSPVNAPLGSDVMSLSDRELCNKMHELKILQTECSTNSDVSLPSPVNAPLVIDVIVFPFRDLCNHKCEPIKSDSIDSISHSDVRLLSPVNAPTAINAIA